MPLEHLDLKFYMGADLFCFSADFLSLFNAAVAQIESAIGSPAGVPLARRF
jgi:hypothetical protein